MKRIILICLLLLNSVIFSQNNNIDKKYLIPFDIEFKGCVKKITLKTLRIDRMSTKIDSVKTNSEVSFSNNGKVQYLKLYDYRTMDSWRDIEFDALERIKNISKNNGILKVTYLNQYFSGNSEFPDSTKSNIDEKYREKYINRFTNNLVTKQERYVNDTLQDYRLYKYNKQNQLIEDLYHNPENDSDETLITSDSKDGYKLSFYPERQTLYEYKKDKDTTIVIKISPKYSRREVIKRAKNKNFELKIVENYSKDFLERKEINWTSKDSLSTRVYVYMGNKEVRDYYFSFQTPKKIVYKSKSNSYNYEQEEEKITVYNIDTVYDKFKNWIKKTRSKDGEIESITERKIDYYCH
ncbi:hypothetical protein ACHRVZ_20505 [Flavobacterium sp. FlaQc-57]|uniref:hypothetical protein n=1 Tax=Flavobacterium sp. FlaQc-57 TaxID=3374186 RepID=UPI003757799E